MPEMLRYEPIATEGLARRGRLHTPHGVVQTPVFMPVGTCGTIKGVTPDHVAAAGSKMILANTYHLLLRPGPDTVTRLGGVHGMMAWDGPILTDSGGYQVFSLAHRRDISDDGVVFASHVDGSRVELTPERAVDIQHQLGADVMMQLDECPPHDASPDEIDQATRRSAAWALRCRDAWDARGRAAAGGHAQALFGIQQGGLDLSLREWSARQLSQLDLPGYAIGGLSVGEGHQAMCHVLDGIDSQLPPAKPRYLMGVGEPRDILAAVLRGVDMFDCVLPTRNGRNAQAFRWDGRIRLRNAEHAERTDPIDPACGCYTCRNFSRGTIRHLFMAREMLGPTLVTIHNLHFFAELMAAIRDSIEKGTLAADAEAWERAMYPLRGQQPE
ncbi:MAG: tRNA guanosine(34) transglycosylase Tgt [Phycisphaerae bacterium]